MIQEYRFPFMAIVEGHMEGATQGNDKLLQALVGMTATTLAPWHVIHPVGTLNVERNDPKALRDGKVTARIAYLGQIYDFDLHGFYFFMYGSVPRTVLARRLSL